MCNCIHTPVGKVANRFPELSAEGFKNESKLGNRIIKQLLISDKANIVIRGSKINY